MQRWLLTAHLLLLLWSMGSRAGQSQSLQLADFRGTGSVFSARGLSCSVARGILPDQGSNLCQCLGRQILVTSHQGSPQSFLLKTDEKELFKQDLVVVWNRLTKAPGKLET